MAGMTRMEECEVVGVEGHLVGMICWYNVPRVASC